MEAPSFSDRSFLVSSTKFWRIATLYYSLWHLWKGRVPNTLCRERYISINNKTPCAFFDVAGMVGSASEGPFFGSHGGDFTDASLERQLFGARFVAQVLLRAIKPTQTERKGRMEHQIQRILRWIQICYLGCGAEVIFPSVLLYPFIFGIRDEHLC